MSKRIILYIDALDECDSMYVREQAYFWRETTVKARKRGTQLSVCLSSRHFPNISLVGCPEIIMEGNNHQDIHQYIEDRFGLVDRGDTEDDSFFIRRSSVVRKWKEKRLKDAIFQKSRGVFLWVVLVVEEVLRKRDDGMDFDYLLGKIDMVPRPLESLFKELLRYVSREERRIALCIFQWAILSASPLRLYEWHHILAFIRFQHLSSLSEWRRNIHCIKIDDQLEKQIRSLSKGLVEVRRIAADEPQGAAFDSLSLHAGAGSLNLDSGGTRVVQVIHESVRGFFLRRNGFALLDPDHAYGPIGYAHMEIMNTCINYIHIHELDKIVDARNRPRSNDQVLLSRLFCSLGKADHQLERDDLNEPWTRDYPINSSSLTGLLKPQNFDKVEVNKKALTRKELEMMQSQFSPIDIPLWMSTNKSELDDLSTSGAPALSIANSSISGRSQTLEDHPALLSYATQEFFTHAKLADLSYTDPHDLLHRLLNLGAWSRLKALREDIPFGAQILEYASRLGLVSWVADILLAQVESISTDTEEVIAKLHSEDNYRRLALSCPPSFDIRSRLSEFIIEDFKKNFPRPSKWILREHELRDDKFVENPEERSATKDRNFESPPRGECFGSIAIPRKQRSIESFGSASSHSGSIHGNSVEWDDAFF
ncbi:unnamed protein product [Clonostachys rhizophaga]|uniref:Uncharacterized protein n=1 Tax=Clonostachys rhizophaga TaxID=160324 RepID=A0A9N9VEF9_9HYPO|nr:unnamed protein product [Clonostachys rhizophaga]